MPSACTNKAVGIECFCMLDGITLTDEPLPAGCLEMAELKMAVPSLLELAVLVEKPSDVTQEARHHHSAFESC